ncbi:MAG: hypothetical protein HY347_08605 [candidate division NC10 bacterium]|nr:hypothetical protein [candidate division NC10 bacterium]
MRQLPSRSCEACPLKLPERGAALVIVLLIMGIMLLLGTTFMTISSTETQIAFNERNAIQAFYLADAGLNKTLSDLNAGAICSSLSDVPLGSGTFTRTVNWGATLDQRIIESTGYVPNSTSASKAQAKVKVTLKGSLFNTALFGGNSTGTTLDIGENSVVDSYDSSQGAYNPSTPGTKAEIGSNANITLKSGATVKCNAVARETITKQSGASVTGVETPNAFSTPVTLPPVSFTFPSGSNVTVHDNDTVTLNPTSFPASYGKLDVGERGTIVLAPGTYSFYKDGDLSIKLEKEATMRISPAGQVKIYINGKLDLKKEAMVNVNADGSAGLPTNLLIYSCYGASYVPCTGEGDGVSSDKDLGFFGAIYAPSTDIRIARTTETSDPSFGIFGSLIGRKVTLDRDSKVHFDAALLKLAPCDTSSGSNPPCPYKPKAGTWQEVLPSS